uniref:Uncharacterized protein n=1 Tax=Setaria viridis TaxID=4556 RepID=A0A4U6VXI3_SETVI|nr:hypothetical protein SEVIR_2G323600v2 [Setaria viridis]
MASSGSDVSDRAAAATTGSLGSLSNPQLANLPAAELVVRLYNNRRGSDFADVAVVLAERERKLAEAEAQIRRAGEREARLQAEVRAWERRATEPEALLPADVRGPDRTAASVGDQEGVEAQQVGAHVISRASEMEVAPLDCTPSAVEAAADLPRLSPLRTTAADALLAPSLQRGELLPIQSECNKENEVSGNSGHGYATVSQGNVCVDKGKGQAKEGYFADATSVASEHSDDDDWIEHLTESQHWEVLNTFKAQVSAWESELNTSTDGCMPTRTAHEGKIVDESEAHVRSEATEARLQDEIVVCERKLLEASKTEERLRAEIMVCKERANETEVRLWAEIQTRGSAITDLEAWKSCAEEAQRQTLAASKIVERLRAEMMECKERANETEVRLWAEIQARGSAVTDLEVWKNCAEEAQRQVHAASMIEARLREEIAACKRKATEAEASHRAEIKACEDKAAAAITGLQDKIVALDGYHTAIQNGLRITIQAMEVAIQYLSGSGPSLSDEVEAMRAQDDSNMQRHGDEQRVSGREHTDPAAASSSHAQASGQQ